MLILFDLPKEQIHAFNTYRNLSNHIGNVERTRGKRKWVFERHSHQRALAFYGYVREQKFLGQPESFEESLEEALKQANENLVEREEDNKPDILEIVTGNVKKPAFIAVTPDVKVEALQKQWCQNYCKNHGYVLFEVSSPTDFKQHSGGEDDHAAG